MLDTTTIETPDVDDELFGTLHARRVKLSKPDIFAMLRDVHPVVRDQEGILRYIGKINPWASFGGAMNYRAEAVNLYVIDHIYTLHSYDCSGFFKPKLAEVCEMIPAGLQASMCAFETVGPRGSADFNRQRSAIQRGYHVGVTILYGSVS